MGCLDACVGFIFGKEEKQEKLDKTGGGFIEQAGFNRHLFLANNLSYCNKVLILLCAHNSSLHNSLPTLNLDPKARKYT